MAAPKTTHSISRFGATLRQVPLPCQSTFTWLVEVNITVSLVLAHVGEMINGLLRSSWSKSRARNEQQRGRTVGSPEESIARPCAQSLALPAVEPPAKPSHPAGPETVVATGGPTGGQASGRPGRRTGSRAAADGIAAATIQKKADYIRSAHGCCRNASRLCLVGARCDI